MGAGGSAPRPQDAITEQQIGQYANEYPLAAKWLHPLIGFERKVAYRAVLHRLGLRSSASNTTANIYIGGAVLSDLTAIYSMSQLMKTVQHLVVYAESLEQAKNKLDEDGLPQLNGEAMEESVKQDEAGIVVVS